MKATRILLILIGLALVLVVANQNIRKHEEVIESGTKVLLELRPVDPRSLIQGDYMFLAYSEKVFPGRELFETLPRRGMLVLLLDDDGVGQYVRMDDGTPLARNEMRLQFKYRAMRDDISIGGETFNFEEGQAEIYSDAKYGVFRVDESGNSVLVGLADEHRTLIRP